MAAYDTPCIILAGGQSRRFGDVKGLAELDGTPLVLHVAAKLSAQTKGLVALNTNTPEAYADTGLMCIADQLTGHLGPLAGLHAAMVWADRLGADHVATAPVDTPFLPDDFLDRLWRAGPPVIAEYEGRMHPVCGVWPVSLKETLARRLDEGLRAARDWALETNAVRAAFPSDQGVDPFFNINTRQDLLNAKSR